MDFRRLNYENISIEEMNKHFKYVCKYYEIKQEPRKPFESATVANVEIRRLHIFLTYRKEGKTVTYHARFDNIIDDDSILPLTSYTTLCKYYKIPKYTGDEKLGYHTFMIGDKQKVGWYMQSTTQFIWYDESKNEKWTEEAYGYDVNSSFSYAMLQPMPNTEIGNIKYDDIVHYGQELGFNMDGSVVEEGPASYVFPLMPSPFKAFVDKWYGFKKNAKTERDRNYAKGMLNFCIGWLQRVNPFLRNAIVYYSNRYIKSFIYDENGKVKDDVLYSNTDSLITTKRRPEIEANIGDNLGQWKFEHAGRFAFSDFSTQWANEIPKYRGVSKCLFERYIEENGDFDITEDTIPDDTFFPYRMEYGFIQKDDKIFPTFKIIKNKRSDLKCM